MRRVWREVVGWGRFGWATLTSMRTALILLFVLGLAAIPGSLLPQRPNDPAGVRAWLAAHPDWAWIDRLDIFDVFGSAWFAAIYLLLFVSLIGCIIPRTAQFGRALRELPAAGPGRLDRLDGFTSVAVPVGPGGARQAVQERLDAAEAHLRAHGYRVRREPSAISAERGYLREAGNLVFHLCLVLTLVGLAWGSLFSFKGTAVVVEGDAFSNTLSQYDEFGSGAAFSPSGLVPFTVKLDHFAVTFETGPVQTGAARSFDASVTVTDSAGTVSQQHLEVNAPLQIGSDSVHLLGHGYAPVVTVTDGQGAVAFSGPVVFLPTDANFGSNGVIKAPDARPDRLAFQGVFLPTAATSASGMVSVFPDALNPRLLLNAWSGAPKAETGTPENVYSLDTTGLTQLTSDQAPLSASLAVGQTMKLPDGKGSIAFDGWKRWTKLQVSNTPGGWLVLGSVVLAVLALSLSLTIRPRRLFVRVVGVVPTESDPDDPGGAEAASVDADQLRITFAGLDRTEGRGGLAEEVAALAAAVGVPANEQEVR